MARGRRRGPDTIRTRERILDASLKLFAQKGFAGTTTKDIARKARVNEVTLFRVFGSKKAIFIATVSERLPVAQAGRTVSFDVDRPADELLVRDAKMVLSMLRDNRDVFTVLFGDAWRMPKLRSVVREAGVERGIQMVSDLVEALMDAGRMRRMDPQIAGRSLVGMIQSYFLAVDLLAGRAPDDEEDERMLRGFVAIFLDGVRAEVSE
jgi:AcrR family transcriptional regulator